MALSTINSIAALLQRHSRFTQGLLPIPLLQSGHCLRLSATSQGGLIIQKPFYADFAGAGAAVGCSFDGDCVAIYVLGTVEFELPMTFADRQAAFQQRIAYSDRISNIAIVRCHDHRATLIVNQLCEWAGLDEAQKIPAAWIARLVGVSPRRIRAAWQQHWLDCQVLMPPPGLMPRSRVEECVR